MTNGLRNHPSRSRGRGKRNDWFGVVFVVAALTELAFVVVFILKLLFEGTGL